MIIVGIILIVFGIAGAAQGPTDKGSFADWVAWLLGVILILIGILMISFTIQYPYPT